MLFRSCFSGAAGCGWISLKSRFGGAAALTPALAAAAVVLRPGADADAAAEGEEALEALFCAARSRIFAMTMDKSLRVRKGSSAARGVLSRAERIGKLKEQDRWSEGRSPLGLPKVRVYKLAMKKKKAAKTPEAEAGKGAAAKPAAGAAKKK